MNTKFCRWINERIRYCSEQILDDFRLGEIESPVDSYWWPYYSDMLAVRNKLKEYGLWDTGEQF